MSSPPILILNGPNLNLLGRREPQIYGTQSFEDYLRTLRQKYPAVTLDYFQSNHEGQLIDRLHAAMATHAGVILNAGGYTHTSVALADAVAAVNLPTVEVHLSNLAAREPFRHHSYLTPRCRGIIAGLGLHGYELALHYLLATLPPD